MTDEPGRSAYHVSISRKLYEKLSAYAKTNNVTMSSVVERVIAPPLGLPLPTTARRRRR